MTSKRIASSVWSGACFVVLFLGTANSHALDTFTSLASYNAAVGSHNVIDFTGLADGTIVTNQFIGLGVTFTDGNDTVFSASVFQVDGKGIDDNGSTTITFLSPINHFGVEFPGAVTIEMYSGATLVSSTPFGGIGVGFFGGVLDRGQSIDRVVLFDHFVEPGIYDNLHFGFVIIPEPATASLALLSMGGLMMRRRRMA